jgi:hypothetical protein
MILIISIPLKDAFQMFKFSLETFRVTKRSATSDYVVSTACFCAGWCSDMACRYSSIWVDFLYTEYPSHPSSLLLTRTSKKGKLPFCSTSTVNFISPFNQLTRLVAREFFLLYKVTMKATNHTYVRCYIQPGHFVASITILKYIPSFDIFIL